MRKSIAVAVIAAFAAVPLATAERPAAPGKSGVATHPSSSPKKGVKPCKKPARHGVKFIIRGVISKAPASGTGEMLVDVTRVNAHAKKALQGADARGGGAYTVPMLPVVLDRCSFITGPAKHPDRRTWRALKAGDRVVLGWSAKRGTAYVDLGHVQRVVDQGPYRAS
jgi:hypothetical protein